MRVCVLLCVLVVVPLDVVSVLLLSSAAPIASHTSIPVPTIIPFLIPVPIPASAALTPFLLLLPCLSPASVSVVLPVVVVIVVSAVVVVRVVAVLPAVITVVSVSSSSISSISSSSSSPSSSFPISSHRSIPVTVPVPTTAPPAFPIPIDAVVLPTSAFLHRLCS